MKKISQDRSGDPKFVAEKIADIIKVLYSSMSLESQQKAKLNMKTRLTNLNKQEVAMKKAPGGAAIGTSIALVKNILNGKDGYFITTVIEELTRLS